jgi:endonuclease/exonuclease/phosphatase family metal-dependent hydrolase
MTLRILAVSVMIVMISGAHAGESDERDFLQDAMERQPTDATWTKMKDLLNTVTVDNSFGTIQSPSKLKVLEYNIEQGLGYSDLVLLLGDGEKFLQEKVADPNEDTRDQVLRAGAADIMIMSELDVGVCRSDYRDVPRDLSRALKMNFAYASEFIELEPKNLGAQGGTASCNNIDYGRTQNLTGDAILSRFPLSNVRRLPLEDCYDWYWNEINPPWYKWISHWPRQLRRGQRAAILADVSVGGSIGTVTVVSAHFEVNAGPGCRRDQMNQILQAVQDVKNPVVIAGDMNTIGIRGPEWGLFDDWRDAGFDLSGNDGKGTDLNPYLQWMGIRLDHVGVRGLKVENGETLTELGKHHIEVSDHAPIAVDLEPETVRSNIEGE